MPEFASREDLNGLGGRVNDLREKVAVTETKIEGIAENVGHVWEAIGRVKDDAQEIRKELKAEVEKLIEGLNKIKVDQAKTLTVIGIGVVVINAIIVRALMHN